MTRTTKGRNAPRVVTAFRALSAKERRRWLDSKEGFQSLSLGQRRQFASHTFRSFVEPYIANPNWIVVTALEMTRRSIEGLRQFIEDPADDVTWNTPVVELQYPVEWDWSAGAPAVPRFRPEDLKDGSTLLRATIRIFLTRKYQCGSEFLTKGAALKKKGNGVTQHVAPWVQEGIDAMTKVESVEFLQDWGEPFILGAALIEETEATPDHPGGLKPFLPFRGTVDGVSFAGSFMVAFKPLVVDEDLRKAFYPVQTSIHFQPDDVGSLPNPSTWSDEDRAKFWESIIDAVTRLLSRFGAKDLAQIRPVKETVAQRTKVAIDAIRRLVSDSAGQATVPVSALDTLAENMRDIARLVEIHEAVGGTARGRRHRLDVLNRSGIVLLVASWEAFVEDLAGYALGRILATATKPSQFSQEILLAASRGLRVAKDERRVLDLAGDGWRDVVRAYCTALIRALNSPGPNEVEVLFEQVMGLTGLRSRWKLHRSNPLKAGKALDALVQRRHRIAHRAASESAVTKKELEAAITLILGLARASTATVKEHLGGLSGSPRLRRPDSRPIHRPSLKSGSAL